METLLSYHNDQEVKDSLILRMEKHSEMDEIIQGATGRNGKGCTVWCALNNGKLKEGYSHSAFETKVIRDEHCRRGEEPIIAEWNKWASKNEVELMTEQQYDEFLLTLTPTPLTPI